MRILAFCFFPAFVPVSTGGQSRLYNFYLSLSRYHSVTLITSTHLNTNEELVRHGANFIERRVPKDNFFVEEYQKLEKFSSGGDISGPALAACGKYPTLLHKAYLEEYDKCDAIFHDFPFLVDYDLFAGIDKKIRIYNAHNCETILYRQLHPNLKSKPIHLIVEEAERKILSFSDMVFYCNQDDLNEFNLIVEKPKFESLYVPNGMTRIDLSLKKNSDSPKTKRAVFMGSGHPPNVKAAKFIVEKLAPEFNDIIFEVVGSCLGDFHGLENVINHGVVGDADKKKILSNCDFALNPMGEGSGSNVKVLEYFSFGLPVISTSFGMRGINAVSGEQYFQSSLEDFSKSIQELVANPQLAESIAHSGRVLAEEEYTWSAIAKKVYENLKKFKKEYSGKELLLVINDYDSFSGVGGGCTRTQGIYDNVKEKYNVVFLSFSDNGGLSVRKHCEGIFVINFPKSKEHLAEENYFNSLFYVSVNDIIAGKNANKNYWLLSIYGSLRRFTKYIVIEHCYMVRIPQGFGDHFFYSSHNHEVALKKRLLKYHPKNGELIAEVEDLEDVAIRNAVLTIAVSYEDAQNLVVGKDSVGPVIVVPNGAALPLKGENVDSLKEKIKSFFSKKSVVFLGSAHIPNIEAAKFIIDNLAAECRDVDFHIVGSVCASIANPPKNVKLWGVVDELLKSAILQSCVLALNPVIGGGGSNIKQADYLGHGLYVISTEFGNRGYPDSVNKHVFISHLDDFAVSIRNELNNFEKFSQGARDERVALFYKELSMSGLAGKFTSLLNGVKKDRKKVLYVSYRYTAPAMGGAEFNIEKFVSALGCSDDFIIDIVAPKISSIHNEMRFLENYTYDNNVGALIDVPNIRFARFDVDELDLNFKKNFIRDAWQAQLVFEKELNNLIKSTYDCSGFTYGWAELNSDGCRWVFGEFGFFLKNSCLFSLKGYVDGDSVISVFCNGALIFGPESIKSNFEFEFFSSGGNIDFTISRVVSEDDPRPLGIYVQKVSLDGNLFSLSQGNLINKRISGFDGSARFEILNKAAEKSRFLNNIRLTDGRGPWSQQLENYIEENVRNYDLVITHNNVFRPAVIAIEKAKKYGVSSILIPHSHLDDDFYHFPDLLKSAKDSSLVLAVPKAACEFYKSKGCNVEYMPAGCDSSEVFCDEDINEFKRVYPENVEFVLVLGRKTPAKGYNLAIEAVDRINKLGRRLKIILIGPDDDGQAINSPNALYLGRQPRSVVRGALLSCSLLVNMSSSESFGIVLLEAWLAGKTVIANKNCAAFHDMAIDDVNSLLIAPDVDEIASGILKLVNNSELAARLAKAGQEQVAKFSWEVVCQDFVEICRRLSMGSMR